MSDEKFAEAPRSIKPKGGPYEIKMPKESNREAWFYMNRGSIDVCIYKKDVGTEKVRIPLKLLRRIVDVLDNAK